MNGRINQPIVRPDGSAPEIQIPTEKLLWQIQVADHPFIGQQRTQLLITGAADIQEAITAAKASPGFEAFKQHFPACAITGAGFLGATE